MKSKNQSIDERIKYQLTTGAKKSKRLINKFHIDSNPPNVLPLYELIEFYGAVESVISTIQKSKNPRIIILETWLIVDYALNRLLVVGLNLQKFENSCYRPLPFSFEARLKLLLNLKAEQQKLPSKPVDYTVRLPMNFLLFCMEHYKEELKIINKVEYEFYKQYSPNQVSVTTTTRGDSSRFRLVPDGWIESVQGIDEKWRKAAHRLNDGRNSAAHSLDPEVLYEKFGFNGSKEGKLKLLKVECNQLLRFLIGVKKGPVKPRNK